MTVSQQHIRYVHHTTTTLSLLRAPPGLDWIYSLVLTRFLLEGRFSEDGFTRRRCFEPTRPLARSLTALPLPTVVTRAGCGPPSTLSSSAEEMEDKLELIALLVDCDSTAELVSRASKGRGWKGMGVVLKLPELL